jgi:hypothetical protein
VTATLATYARGRPVPRFGRRAHRVPYLPFLSPLSAFAIASLAIAVVYLGLSTALAATVRVIVPRSTEGTGALHLPGRHIQRELENNRGRCRRYGTAALLFTTSFAALVFLGHADRWVDLPAWTAMLSALLVIAALLSGAVRFVRLARRRHQLRSLLSCELTIAQRLSEVQLRGHRIFHAVPVGNRVIDHVVVGSIGVFAAQVIPPPDRRATGVRLDHGLLTFHPHGAMFPLHEITEAFALLTKELSRAVGHRVKIVPTLIVPGCRVLSRDDPRYLLTNEQNCISLVGWKDSEAFLMDDEVGRIAAWLTGRCTPSSLGLWRRVRRLHPTRPRGSDLS